MPLSAASWARTLAGAHEYISISHPFVYSKKKSGEEKRGVSVPGVAMVDSAVTQQRESFFHWRAPFLSVSMRTDDPDVEGGVRFHINKERKREEGGKDDHYEREAVKSLMHKPTSLWKSFVRHVVVHTKSETVCIIPWRFSGCKTVCVSVCVCMSYTLEHA